MFTDITQYFQFKVHQDVLFCLLYSQLYMFRVLFHPSSGAQLQPAAIGVCMILVCWSIGAGTGWYTLTLPARSISDFDSESEVDRAKSVKVSQPVPAPMDKHTKTIHTPMAVRCSCAPEDGCK
jgi:hypothetical protein